MSVAAVSGVVRVDAADIVALARDPRRHAFLLRTTGSDYAAQAEIAAAQRLLAGRDEPDLRALLELAVYRNAMSLRNQCLPFALPGVWARLGRLDHAEALARAIPDHDAREAALEDVAAAAAGADPDAPAEALEDVTTAAVQAGDLDHAEAQARTITQAGQQARALAELASIAAQAGDRDRAARLVADAEAVARRITDPESLSWVLTGLAGAVAAGPRPGLRRGPGPHDSGPGRPGTSARLSWPAPPPRRATWTARCGSRPRPKPRPARSPSRTTRRGRSTSSPPRPPGPATWTAQRLWPAPSDRGQERSAALDDLAIAAARAGDAGRAAQLAADAEATARSLPEPYSQANMLAVLVNEGAQAGDPDRPGRLATEAEAIARTIADPGDQASVAADPGHGDRRGRRPGARRARWPAPSPTPSTGTGRSPSWPRRLPRPATRTARASWPRTRRLWPGPSPTPTIGPARWPGWPTWPLRPATRTARSTAGRRRRGPGPRPVTDSRGQGWILAELAARGRPGRRPGPGRGPGPHHHRPELPGTVRSHGWPPRPPRPATRAARTGWPPRPRPWPAPSPIRKTGHWALAEVAIADDPGAGDLDRGRGRWPAPSPTRTPRSGRSPSWPARPLRPATRTAPGICWRWRSARIHPRSSGGWRR